MPPLPPRPTCMAFLLIRLEQSSWIERRGLIEACLPGKIPPRPRFYLPETRMMSRASTASVTTPIQGRASRRRLKRYEDDNFMIGSAMPPHAVISHLLHTGVYIAPRIDSYAAPRRLLEPSFYIHAYQGFSWVIGTFRHYFRCFMVMAEVNTLRRISAIYFRHRATSPHFDITAFIWWCAWWAFRAFDIAATLGILLIAY